MGDHALKLKVMNANKQQGSACHLTHHPCNDIQVAPLIHCGVAIGQTDLYMPSHLDNAVLQCLQILLRNPRVTWGDQLASDLWPR